MDSAPIRTRLAGVSALMTFVIIFAFAVIVGSLTVHRIRADFNREVAASASDLADLMEIEARGSAVEGYHFAVHPNLDQFAASEHAVVRILSVSGTVLASTTHAPDLGLVNETYADGYRVHTTLYPLRGASGGDIYVQYARPTAGMQDTINRVRLLLIIGVLVGTGLAGLAGLSIARRAMSPIAQLTSTAAEIAKTRDARRGVPQPEADDEVAELARTLQSMLRELDSAHAETEAILARQRQFVADASHELRTPLTSVLANLELLADTLHGEQGEAAASALRSSKRMRRLVADLLLLARTDVGRVVPHQPVDLAQIVIEAAAELGPISSRHELLLELEPVIVEAAGDELHRLVINLIENALRHTPPGSIIWVRSDTEHGQARLIVEDNGPGIPEQLRATLFERFVRGAGDRGGSFGLGLAIVRAVAESHGGSVTVEQTQGERGARFVIRLPHVVAPTGNDERLSHASHSV